MQDVCFSKLRTSGVCRKGVRLAAYAALLSGVVLVSTAQNPSLVLPDTPAPQISQNKCGPWSCWDYNHKTLSVKQTFTNKHFWIPTAIGDAAYWTDVAVSLKAIHNGCIESNTDLPAHATAGDYAVNWAKFELPMDLLQWMLVKLNRKSTNYFVVGMASARVAVHMHGVATSVKCL